MQDSAGGWVRWRCERTMYDVGPGQGCGLDAARGASPTRRARERMPAFVSPIINDIRDQRRR